VCWHCYHFALVGQDLSSCRYNAKNKKQKTKPIVSFIIGAMSLPSSLRGWYVEVKG
jgi:hypothetical protein